MNHDHSFSKFMENSRLSSLYQFINRDMRPNAEDDDIGIILAAGAH
jgi:hypothetical protein